MVSADLNSRPTSRLARKICEQLLETKTTPDIVCPDTGEIIKGRKDWTIATKYNAGAAGAFYKAFGFGYFLCYAGYGVEYVAVFRLQADGSGKIVGRVWGPDKIALTKKQ